MLTNTAWADGQKELDIVIAALRLTLGAKEARAETYPLAVVSQNAAARRFRRALKEHAAIMGDLAALAQINLPDLPTPNFSLSQPRAGEKGAVR